MPSGGLGEHGPGIHSLQSARPGLTTLPGHSEPEPQGMGEGEFLGLFSISARRTGTPFTDSGEGCG